MNDNKKTASRTELEARCLRDIDAIETWTPVPLLRGIAKEVSLDPAFDGDYKDAIASKSARLRDKIWGYACQARTSVQRRMYDRVMHEASKRGLLNGYDCPRATSAAWAALMEGDE
jgi:hypothetical protein